MKQTQLRKENFSTDDFNAMDNPSKSILEIAGSDGKKLIVYRGLAELVDLSLLFIIGGALLMTLPEEMNGARIPAFIIFVLTIRPYLESFYGYTPGKSLFGLRVVNQFGEPPSFRNAVLRNTTRFFEVYSLCGLIAIAVLSRSRYQQRLGDQLADTFVVWQKDLERLP